MHFYSNKKGISLFKSFLLLALTYCLVNCSFAQQPTIKLDSVVKTDSIIQKFYAINLKPLYWLSSRKDAKRATEWLMAIELAKESGIVSRNIRTDHILTPMSAKKTRDRVLMINTDQQITSLVLSFIKELQEVNAHFEYDELSSHLSDSVYIFQLMNSRNKGPVSKIVSELDCQDHDYQILKKFLKDSIKGTDSLKYKKVAMAMNYLRYLSVNKQAEYIVVNIPETEARYYQKDQLMLKMKIVVGKKKNPTPTIASYITDIVTFPCWNVPFSIASKELFPKVQKDESYLERNNFEVVDSKGNIVDDSDLNWGSYTEKTFPYFFRESTGPNNSLGVLKFYMQNPFSIYLHDTNSKGEFAKDFRFLSHGCIRLEKPIELADLLTGGNIDDLELKTGKKNTESKTIKLDRKVQVFIVYMPVTVDGEKVTFLKDIYDLVK